MHALVAKETNGPGDKYYNLFITKRTKFSGVIVLTMAGNRNKNETI
jgi:hypothetical protein